MTPPTFFARFVSCKSPLSNFYKHDFWFRGKCFDGMHRAYQYHWAILLKKHKVAKSIMNAALAYHTAKQRLSRIQCKRALDIVIVIKLMHELLWEKHKQVNEFSQEYVTFMKQCILGKDSGNSFWGSCCPTTQESWKNLHLYRGSNILGWIIMLVHLGREKMQLMAQTLLPHSTIRKGLKLVLQTIEH